MDIITIFCVLQIFQSMMQVDPIKNDTDTKIDKMMEEYKLKYNLEGLYQYKEVYLEEFFFYLIHKLNTYSIENNLNEIENCDNEDCFQMTFERLDMVFTNFKENKEYLELKINNQKQDIFNLVDKNNRLEEAIESNEE